MKDTKKSDEEIKNLIELMQFLKNESEHQKTMTTKEKKENPIKMGDIYY